MAHFRAGERADALATLRQVLDKGLHEGVYQTILDQGPEIGALLLSVRENAERTGDFRSCFLPRSPHRQLCAASVDTSQAGSDRIDCGAA